MSEAVVASISTSRRPGMALAREREQARHDVGRDGRISAERERPGERLAVAERRLDEAVHVRERGARALHDQAAGGRERHAPLVALEERHAEQLLELADLRAERGLAHVAGRRRRAELQRVRDGEQVLEWRSVGRARACDDSAHALP